MTLSSLINKTAILSTVANFELYNKTSKLFPAGIQVYVIDGRNGMHGLHSILYMFKKLRNRDIEWLIMADEDVIFTNPEEIFSLISFMASNNYTVSGVRDGGEVSHRNKNPYAINTFFSILDFKKVSNLFNAKEILQNQYIKEGEFTDDLDQLAFDFDKTSLYEPYYCFYFWLRRKGEKIFFLDSKMLEEENEKISNEVFNANGTSLLIHTWYARSYGNNKKHTTRIDRVLEKTDFKLNSNQAIVFKDYMFWIKMRIFKIHNKIKMRLTTI
jgi:hypothetical protein